MSKFKYAGPKEATAADLEKPKSGMFNGYFMWKKEGDDEPTKVKEKNIQIDFKPVGDGMFTVSGVGANDFGVFKLKGTYSAATKALVCTREYEADDDDDDDDDDDELDDDVEEDDELDALKEEGEMDIEELRRRYAAREAEEDGAAAAPPAKRQKPAVQDDDDEEDF